MRGRHATGRDGRRPRLGPEALEGRDLLALLPFQPSNTFAVFEPRVPSRGQGVVEVDVSEQDFDAGASGRVLLTTYAEALTRGQAAPRSVGLSGARVSPAGNARFGPYAANVARVGFGDARIRVSATPGTVGVGVALTGDATADFRVDQLDLDRIQSLQGVRAGQAAYSPAADSDLNGRINRRDLQLAQQNFGASTSVRTLQGVSAQSTGKANVGAVKDRATVTGAAPAGLEVVLTSTAPGVPSQTTRASADATGRYSAVVPLVAATTIVVAEAEDTFGQRASAVVPVVMPTQDWPLGARYSFRNDFGQTITDFTLLSPTMQGNQSNTYSFFAPSDLLTFESTFATGLAAPSDTWAVQFTDEDGRTWRTVAPVVANLAVSDVGVPFLVVITSPDAPGGPALVVSPASGADSGAIALVPVA